MVHIGWMWALGFLYVFSLARIAVIVTLILVVGVVLRLSLKGSTVGLIRRGRSMHHLESETAFTHPMNQC